MDVHHVDRRICVVGINVLVDVEQAASCQIIGRHIISGRSSPSAHIEVVASLYGVVFQKLVSPVNIGIAIRVAPRSVGFQGRGVITDNSLRIVVQLGFVVKGGILVSIQKFGHTGRHGK